MTDTRTDDRLEERVAARRWVVVYYPVPAVARTHRDDVASAQGPKVVGPFRTPDLARGYLETRRVLPPGYAARVVVVDTP